MLWSIIVGGVIGLIAGSITKKGGSMGVIANVVAGLVGSAVGQSLLGTWGPSLADMTLLPSISSSASSSRSWTSSRWGFWGCRWR